MDGLIYHTYTHCFVHSVNPYVLSVALTPWISSPLLAIPALVCCGDTIHQLKKVPQTPAKNMIAEPAHSTTRGWQKQDRQRVVPAQQLHSSVPARRLPSQPRPVPGTGNRKEDNPYNDVDFSALFAHLMHLGREVFLLHCCTTYICCRLFMEGSAYYVICRLFPRAIRVRGWIHTPFFYRWMDARSCAPIAMALVSCVQ